MIYGVYGQVKLHNAIYEDYAYIKSQLDTIENISGLVHGGGKGVESLCARWAHDVLGDDNVHLVPPNMQLHGKHKAFVERDIEILTLSEAVVVFWDGIMTSIPTIISRAVVQYKTVLVFPLYRVAAE